MKLSGIFGLRPSAKYISASMAALGALAITAQANAADIYAPVPGGYKDIPIIAPMPVWTGFYAGVNMGAAWSELNVNRFYEPGYTTCVAPGVGGGYCFGGDRLNSTNAFGGGQFGYNWQGWGNFVVGLEVDLEGIAGGNERSFFGVTHPAGGHTHQRHFQGEWRFRGRCHRSLGLRLGELAALCKGRFRVVRS